MSHIVTLSRAWRGEDNKTKFERESITLTKPFEAIVQMQYREECTTGYKDGRCYVHDRRSYAQSELRSYASRIKFLDATGLRISNATRWPGWPNMPPGTDHLGEWRDPTIKGRRWLVLTSEPYRHLWPENESLIRWCDANGWRREIATWEGMWNPPHTRLEVLAPRDYPRWDEVMAAMNSLPNVAA